MLKLYLGRDSNHKRKTVFSKIMDLPEATVITPEQSTLAYESQMIESLDLKGLLHVQVTSLSHILNRLSREIVESQETHITDIGKRLLYRSVMKDLAKDLRVFRGSRVEGFYDELEKLIDRLLRDDIQPEALLELADLQKDALNENKLRDLSLIFRTWQDRLRARFFDREKSIQLFEEIGHRYRLYSDQHVVFLDYKHFDSDSLRMLRCIEAHTGTVHVVLPYEEGQAADLYAVTHETRMLLQDLFHDIQVEWISSQDSAVVQFLKAWREEAPCPQAPLRFFEAEDLYEEVEFIGLDILKKLRLDPALALENIRIITTDLDRYEMIVEHVFSRLGIPLFSDRRKNILQTRVMKSILALLNLYPKRFEREDVFSFLKGYIPEASWDQLDLFENYCIEEGVNYGSFLQPLGDETMEALRRDLLGKAIDYVPRFMEKQSPGAHCDALKDLLLELRYPEHILEEALALREQDEEDASVVLTQVWNLLLEVLGQIQEVVSSEAVTLKEFRQILEMSLKDLSVGTLPPTEGKVTLATLHRSTHKPCEILYFCGMNDGLWPREYDEGGLLRLQEKTALCDLGYLFHDTPEFNEALDELDLFIALSLVEKELIFSWSMGDYSGEAAMESPLVRLAMELTGRKPERSLSDHYYEEPMQARRFALEAIKAGKDITLHGLDEDDLRRAREALKEVKLEPIRRDMGRFRPSVTKLETFRECPFRHYVKYDLAPKERKDYRVSLPDIGNLYHILIEQTLRHFELEPTEEELDGFLKEKLEELLKTADFKVFLSTPSTRHLLSKVERILRFVLRQLYANLRRSAFKPEHFEEWVRLNLSHYQMRGKIDRIDCHGDHFTVIDYKSGQKRFDLNSVYQGVDLQLVLYADAFSREKPQQRRVAGLFFFPVSDPLREEGSKREETLRMKGILVGETEGLDLGGDYQFLPLQKISDQQMEALVRHVRRQAESMIDKIEAGVIEAKPLKQGDTVACQYCDYASICRFEGQAQIRSLEKLDDKTIRERLEEDHEMDR